MLNVSFTNINLFLLLFNKWYCGFFFFVCCYFVKENYLLLFMGIYLKIFMLLMELSSQKHTLFLYLFVDGEMAVGNSLIAVEPGIASIIPSEHLVIETWSIQTLVAPNKLIPSPSLTVLSPICCSESLIKPPLLGTTCLT